MLYKGNPAWDGYKIWVNATGMEAPPEEPGCWLFCYDLYAEGEQVPPARVMSDPHTGGWEAEVLRMSVSTTSVSESFSAGNLRDALEWAAGEWIAEGVNVVLPALDYEHLPAAESSAFADRCLSDGRPARVVLGG